MSAKTPTKKPRDIRLDFFRGLCLFIIFIAHMFENPWAAWIPARFGFSDATEIFVFCSGMASAIAFGAVFAKRGLLLGTARIVHRIWQVYWAHIGVFLVTLALMVAADNLLGTGTDYRAGLMMEPLFDGRADAAVLGLVTLRYVPPFFDILPMYLVILALVPVVMAIHRLGRGYAAAFVIGLWLLASFRFVELSREPWGDAVWYFDPFAWQLIFFTGFALMRGWLPAPPIDRRLIWAAVAVVALSVPFEWQPALQNVEVFRQGRELLGALIDKSHLGPLRYIHFLALAYLSYVAVGDGGSRIRGAIATVVCRVGQQSLAVFVSGLVLSFAASIFLNVAGRTMLTVPIANVGGILALIGIAYTVAWFKSAPWAQPIERGIKIDDKSAGQEQSRLQGSRGGLASHTSTRLAPAE